MEAKALGAAKSGHLYSAKAGTVGEDGMRGVKAPRSEANSLTRREFSRTLAAAGLSLAALPVPRGTARAAGAPTYFTWRGYDTPALFPEYIETHEENPAFTTFRDPEEAFRAVRAGFEVALVHPCYEAVPRWRDADLIQPIDTTRLPFWGGVMPKLKDLPGTRFLGRQWFVPVDWGQTSFTYRTDLVALPEEGETWGLLWDERYRGRIAVSDHLQDAWWCAAIHAGLDLERIGDADLPTVRSLLVEQRPLLRAYASDPAVLEQGLASGEIVAAMTWNESAVRLRAQGLPVKFANPAEGALTWCCGVVLRKNTPDLDKAHDLINALLDPRAGAHLIDAFGYGHANINAFDRVDKARLTRLGLSEKPHEVVRDAVFVGPQPPDLIAKIERDWRRVLSGS